MSSRMIISLFFSVVQILTFASSANVDFNSVGRGCCRNSAKKSPAASSFNKFVKVGSLAKCQKICAQTSETCTAIEFTNKNGGICEVHTTKITNAKLSNCKKSKCYTASFSEMTISVHSEPAPVVVPVQAAAPAPANLPPPPAQTTATKKVCILQPKFDLSGGDLKQNGQPEVQNAAQCAMACIEHAECKKFTYVWKKCFLKDASAGETKMDDAVSAVCSTTTVIVTTPAAVALVTATAVPITTTAAPVTTATPVTTANGGRAALTTNPAAAPVTSTAAPVTTTVALTTAAAPAATAESGQDKCELVMDIDYKKNDLAYGRVQTAQTHVDCATECLDHPGCTVFTFIKAGACFLKYKAGKARSRTGTISGICKGGSKGPAPAPTLQTAPPAPAPEPASKPAPAPPSTSEHSSTLPPPPPSVSNYNGQKRYVKLSLDFSFKKFEKLPKSLMEAQGGSVNGKLYVFGGFVNGYRTMAKETWEWDPAATRWSQKKSIPSQWAGATHMANAVDESTKSIYLLGGIVNFGNNKFPKGSVDTNNVFKYNAKADSWSKLPSLPEARGGGAAVVLNNKLHFFNGAKFDGTNGGFQKDMSTHWQLNLANVNAGWKKLAPNSLGRNHVGGAVWGGKIYAIGGQFFEEEGCTNQKLAEVYNPKTNTWSRIADLPVGTGHISPSTLSTPHGILVVGGVTDKNRGCKPPGFKREQMLFYNPTTNKWSDYMNYHPGASMVSGLINGKVWAQHGQGIKEIGIKFKSAKKKVGRSSAVQSESSPNRIAEEVVALWPQDSPATYLAGSNGAIVAVGAVATVCMVAVLVGVVIFLRSSSDALATPTAEDPPVDQNDLVGVVEVVVDTDTSFTIDMFEDDDLATLASLTKMDSIIMI